MVQLVLYLDLCDARRSVRGAHSDTVADDPASRVNHDGESGNDHVPAWPDVSCAPGGAPHTAAHEKTPMLVFAAEAAPKLRQMAWSDVTFWGSLSCQRAGVRLRCVPHYSLVFTDAFDSGSTRSVTKECGQNHPTTSTSWSSQRCGRCCFILLGY